MMLKKFAIICGFFCSFVNSKNIYLTEYVFEWGKTHPEIVRKYLEINASDNAYAAYLLGTLHVFGIFLEKNIELAEKYITFAAERNLPDAINSIGDGYITGDIRPIDEYKALEHYVKAANLGFGPAQFNAGIMFLRKLDFKNAIRYFELASKNTKDLGNDMANAAKEYIKHAKRLSKNKC